MDTARYLLALIVIITFPAGLPFWFLVHGFIGFWRRVGLLTTYVAMTVLMLVIGVAMYSVSEPLLSVDYGTNWGLIGLAALCYMGSVVIEFLCRRHLSLRILVGVPELKRSAENQHLLQTGIYGRVRHPRYLAFILGEFGVAFFVNYLCVYVFVPIFWIAIYLITLLEERELMDRFGKEYANYRAQVPRLFPRLHVSGRNI